MFTENQAKAIRDLANAVEGGLAILSHRASQAEGRPPGEVLFEPGDPGASAENVALAREGAEGIEAWLAEEEERVAREQQEAVEAVLAAAEGGQ